jgi:hypothetical protein
MLKVSLKNKLYNAGMNSAAVVFCFLCGFVIGPDFTIISLGTLMLIKLR